MTPVAEVAAAWIFADRWILASSDVLGFASSDVLAAEDKVIKNYVATEFLHEYLKDKKTVGVIGEELDRGISSVAEPIGVVVAVAAKTRNAIVFRPAARARRCAVRAAEILREAGERAGLPAGALQVVAEPSNAASSIRSGGDCRRPRSTSSARCRRSRRKSTSGAGSTRSAGPTPTRSSRSAVAPCSTPRR